MLIKTQPEGSLVVASTPDGFNFFHKLFNAAHDSNLWKAWHYKSTDGGYMTEEQVNRERDNMTYEAWRQEYFAEFIGHAGRVYYNFDLARHCKPVTFVEGADIYWCWDFNVKPCVHSVLCHINKGKVYQFGEICIGETPDTVNAFIAQFPPEAVGNIIIYGDYNGSISTTGVSDYQLIEQMLRRAGYPEPDLRIAPNPPERDRTNAVNGKMLNANGQVGYYINKHKCPKTVSDFLDIKRHEKTGKIDKAADPNKTHASDALGYMIASEFPTEWARKKRVAVEKRPVVNDFGYWV